MPFDSGLFERLRELRRDIATASGVPAYIIFGDASLQDMACIRPTRPESFAVIKGVGERKAAEFSGRFTQAIGAYCAEHRLSTDILGASSSGARRPSRSASSARSAARQRTFELFERGCSLDEVARTTGLAPSTAAEHLSQYIEETKPESVSAWVDPATYSLILSTARKLNAERLKPIFEHLAGLVPYEKIRVALVHARVKAADNVATRNA